MADDARREFWERKTSGRCPECGALVPPDEDECPECFYMDGDDDFDDDELGIDPEED